MHAVDGLRFPSFEQPPNAADLMFLAEISLQLLLNRVHYPPNSPHSLSSSTPEDLLDVCDDLCRRLDIWHQSLPSIIQPDLSTQKDANSQSYILRLRYWSTRDIICRPLVTYVASLAPGETVSPEIMDKCHTGLFSCRSFLFFSGNLLSKYTPYTYSASIK
jgi:hypothetical protein